MRKSTSRVAPPSRKSGPLPAIPDDYMSTRWSDDDLHRILALSTLGVVVFGAAWLTWRSGWLLWPAGICALALQLSATMVAARSAVGSGSRARGRHRRKRRPTGETMLSSLARLIPAEAPSDPTRAAASEDDREETTNPQPLTLPAPAAWVHDEALHRAFFRRVVEAEFTEFGAGTVWPDLGALQGSLITRLRLFQRHVQTSPVPAREVSEADRTPHSPWHHLAALEAADYRRADTLARLAHRAFAPLAFLELHARLDLEAEERRSLEAEISRQYTVGYGRVLTPPAVLTAAEPLRHRMGGIEAITLVDEARLSLRSSSNLREAERLRAEWLHRARTQREREGWPSQVMSMAEALIDYWLVQRAAAADIEWAEELARLDDSSIGAALAKRDATGTFHFADTIRLVLGSPSRTTDALEPQLVAPTATETVA